MMKYLIIGVMLMLTLIISKLFVALNLTTIDTFQTPSKPKESIETRYTHIGTSLYAMHCTSCHGQKGDGNRGKAQDHTFRIAKKSVLHVIEQGSNHFTSTYPAGMPGGLLQGKEAEAVALYVAQGLSGEVPTAWSICASCHDDSGEGIPFVAPNIKTYSDELVITVLTHGKKGAIGTMPSFKERLTPLQMKGLAHYIRSLQK